MQGATVSLKIIPFGLYACLQVPMHSTLEQIRSRVAIPTTYRFIDKHTLTAFSLNQEKFVQIYEKYSTIWLSRIIEEKKLARVEVFWKAIGSTEEISLGIHECNAADVRKVAMDVSMAKFAIPSTVTRVEVLGGTSEAEGFATHAVHLRQAAEKHEQDYSSTEHQDSTETIETKYKEATAGSVRATLQGTIGALNDSPASLVEDFFILGVHRENSTDVANTGKPASKGSNRATYASVFRSILDHTMHRASHGSSTLRTGFTRILKNAGIVYYKNEECSKLMRRTRSHLETTVGDPHARPIRRSRSPLMSERQAEILYSQTCKVLENHQIRLEEGGSAVWARTGTIPSTGSRVPSDPRVAVVVALQRVVYAHDPAIRRAISVLEQRSGPLRSVAGAKSGPSLVSRAWQPSGVHRVLEQAARLAATYGCEEQFAAAIEASTRRALSQLIANRILPSCPRWNHRNAIAIDEIIANSRPLHRALDKARVGRWIHSCVHMCDGSSAVASTPSAPTTAVGLRAALDLLGWSELPGGSDLCHEAVFHALDDIESPTGDLSQVCDDILKGAKSDRSKGAKGAGTGTEADQVSETSCTWALVFIACRNMIGQDLHSFGNEWLPAVACVGLLDLLIYAEQVLRSLSRSSAASRSPVWSQIDRQGAAPQLIKATTQCLDCLAKELGVVGRTQASRLVHKMQSNIRTIRDRANSSRGELGASARRLRHTDTLPVRRGASTGLTPDEHGTPARGLGRTAAAVAQAKDALRAILHRCSAARYDNSLALSDPSLLNGKGLPIDMRLLQEGTEKPGTPSPSQGHAKGASPIAAGRTSGTTSPSSLVRTSSAGSGSGMMCSAPQAAPTGSEEYHSRSASASGSSWHGSPLRVPGRVPSPSLPLLVLPLSKQQDSEASASPAASGGVQSPQHGGSRDGVGREVELLAAEEAHPQGGGRPMQEHAPVQSLLGALQELSERYEKELATLTEHPGAGRAARRKEAKSVCLDFVLGERDERQDATNTPGWIPAEQVS